MSEKVRVHEVAKELGITSKEVIDKAKDMGLEVKAAQSTMNMQEAEDLANYIMNGVLPKSAQKPKKSVQKAPKEPKEVKEQASEVSPKEDTTPPEKKQKEQTQAKPSEQKKHQEEQSQDQDKSLAEATPKVKEHSGPKLAQPQVKRKGLTIVKKKKPVREESSATSMEQVKRTSSYGKLGADVLEELQKKKKPKKSADTPRKKEGGVKLDIFGDIGDVSMDFEEDQIELIDINMTERKEIQVEEPRKPREPKPIGRNANKKAGGNRPRKVAKEKKKKYKKESKNEETTDQICDKCGAPMVVKQGPRGKFLACSAYPKCKNTKPLNDPKKLSVKCPECGGDILERYSKRGKFFGCSNYPECKFISKYEPTEKKCVECGYMTAKRTYRGKEVYECIKCKHKEEA